MEGNHKEAWNRAINLEFNTHQRMGFWQIIDWPREEQVMHTKFVLKKNFKEKGAVCKYKGYLVVCGNEEVDC